MDPGENSVNDKSTNNSITARNGEIEAKEIQKESDMKEDKDPYIVQDLSLNLSIQKPKRGQKYVNASIPPRRNPRRKTQLNRKSYNLINDDLLADIKEEKARKAIKTNKKPPAKKSVRSTSRTRINCGAVYSPPSPLSQKHIRTWPAEGLHERPEYDPNTGKIQPLDHVVQSIVENNNKSKNSKTETKTSCQENKNDSQTSEDEDRVDVLTHVLLHQAISSAASALQIQKREDKSIDQHKINYFKYFGLEPKKNDDGAYSLNYTSSETDDIKHNLKELSKDTMMKYCVANKVQQSDLAKYIDSLTTEDITNILNGYNAASSSQPTGSS